jgi:hypothetical protein
LIPDDDALRAAARLRERLPLVAAHRFDDAPRTRAERNAAHCRAWRAKVRAAARGAGMTVEQYRAMVRAQQEGDATSG